MTERIQKRRGRAEKVKAEETAAPEHVDAEKLKADLDELLDEIEGVLEENAEDFVSAYVQAGGE